MSITGMQHQESVQNAHNECESVLQGLTLLMIEDDEFFADIVKTKLSAFGCNLIITDKGDETLSLTKKHTPDVLLLDLQLPKTSGVEILRKFKADPVGRDIPVIVFTNSSNEQDIEAVSAAGADEYLIKVSTDLHTLADKICRVVQK